MLTAIFAAVCAVVAIKMMLPEDLVRVTTRVPRGGAGAAIASVIGGISAMTGIGGGTLSVAVMTLSGMAIHTAIGTAAVFGFAISLPATISYLMVDAPAGLPVGTVGLVSILGALLIAPGSVLAAPLGAWLAHSLSRAATARVFAAFLLVVAARMVYRTLR